MKPIIMALLFFGATLTWAEDFPLGALLGVSDGTTAVQETRTFRQLGVSLTRGNDTGWNSLGYGYTFRTLNFFDAGSVGGWYWGAGLSIGHLGGGPVSIGDQQLVTLGWMGRVGFLDIDLGLGPTLGTRIQGSTILGALYTGAGFTVGLHVPFAGNQDLGISWEPVIPLTSWGGPPAPNQGYMDFVVAWTSKFRTETKTSILPWSPSEAPTIHVDGGSEPL